MIPVAAAVRPGLVALVTAIVVNIVITLIGRGTGDDLEVTQSGATQEIGIPIVMAMTVAPLVVATVGLALAGRWGARGWNALAWTGLAIGVVSTVLPLTAQASTTTRLTLAVMHVAVGLSWFLAVRRALPTVAQDRPA